MGNESETDKGARYPKKLERELTSGSRLIAFILAVVIIVVSLIMHTLTVIHESKAENDRDLELILKLMDKDDLSNLFFETKRRYFDVAESFDDCFSSEYTKNFSDLMDYRYDALKSSLMDYKRISGQRDVALCFNDPERKRLVYVIDGNSGELAFTPGQWEPEEAWIAADSSPVFYPDGNVMGHFVIELDIKRLGMELLGFLALSVPMVFFGIFLLSELAADAIKEKLVVPIRMISDAACEYAEMDENDISDGKLVFSSLSINREDELLRLLDTLKLMEQSISTSVRRIGTLNAERERVEAELSIAGKIQASLLPGLTPEFTDVREFDIYALMNPAREVGGDFYDFFMADDHTVAFLVADVSDKGVGAALFMAISKALIRMRAEASDSPGRVLCDVDRQLSEENDADMFVTVWLGFLDIRTGHVKACNAGHDYPAILRKNASGEDAGVYSLYEEVHGSPLVFWPGMPFPEVEYDLSPGDSIFLYTDGVSEAQSEDRKEFGTDRMLKVLNENKGKDAKSICLAVKKAVDDYVGDSPQYDDITMLAINYKG